jgi:general secretion pathway protein K
LVLASLALLTVLSFEILFATRVDLRIGRNARDRLQAYYLAMSGARLTLLRLHMYKEVKNLTEGGQQLPVPEQTIDQIWAAPLPELPMAGMNVDWPGKISARLTSEGSKIPINLLDGNVHRRSSPEIAKQVREEIATLIKAQFDDEEFDKAYRGLEPDDLINPLEDWLDADSDRKGGGDENSDYEKLGSPYRPRNDRIPTLEELHLVRGWTDDLFRRLAPSFSVLNLNMEVNPNYLPRSRIKAAHKPLTDSDLDVIDKKRLTEPFKDLADMQRFIREEVGPNGRDFTWPSEMKEGGRQEIFILESTGIVAEARRTLKMGIRFLTEKPKAQAGQGGGTSQPSPPGAPGGPTGGTTGAGGGDSGGGSDGGANKPKPGKLLEPVVVTIEETLS